MSLADVETSEEKLERLMLEDALLFEVSEVGDWSYYLERRRKEEEIERKDAEWEKHLKNEEEKKKRRGRRRGQGPSRYRVSSESDEEEESDNLSPTARIRKNRELASKFMNQNESYKMTNEYLMDQYNRLHKRKAEEKAKEAVDWRSTWSSDSESAPEPEEPELVAIAPKEQSRQSESSSAVKQKSKPVDGVIPRKAKKNRKEKNAMLMALEKKKQKDQPSVSDVPNSTNKKGGSKAQAGNSQKNLNDGSESVARLTAILLGKESETVVKPVTGGTEDDDDDSKKSVSSSSSSYFTASSSGAHSDKEDPSNSSKPSTNNGNLCSGDSTDVYALESKKKVMHTTSKRVRRLPVKFPLSSAPPGREFRFNPPAGRGRFNIKSSSDFPTL